MTITDIVIIVSAVGALGGVINCTITGEFNLPQFDSGKKIWRPGWIGNVLIGAVAALVVWGIYGPLATYDFAAPESTKQLITLTLSQLFMSVLIGLGGGNILTELSQKQATRLTQENLLATIATVGKAPRPAENKPTL